MSLALFDLSMRAASETNANSAQNLNANYSKRRTSVGRIGAAKRDVTTIKKESAAMENGRFLFDPQPLRTHGSVLFSGGDRLLRPVRLHQA
jgi:hypothetical protein